MSELDNVKRWKKLKDSIEYSKKQVKDYQRNIERDEVELNKLTQSMVLQYQGTSEAVTYAIDLSLIIINSQTVAESTLKAIDTIKPKSYAIEQSVMGE